jgi:GT2 family glycosyltransferase
MKPSSKSALPFVSIIIINWNGRHYLEKLLPILNSQSYPKDKFEIIVLDNDSTRDDSVEYVKEHFKNVILIENNQNDGFARGCNLAIRESKGKYVVLLNNDTAPKKDWLERLIDCTVGKSDLGAVVSKVIFANYKGQKNIINNAGSILHPNQAWPVEEIGANKPDGPEYDKEIEITALCGTSLLLTREMLDDIGLFDETFFMYFEDADLSWRGQQAKWKFYFCPDSVVIHEHSGSSKEHSAFWTFYVTRNRLLIMWKHASLLLALRVYLVFIKEFLAVPVILGLIGRERRHQLYMVKLGLRINLSFLKHLPSELLRRWGVLKEFTF